MILHQPMLDLKFDKQRPRKYVCRGHGAIAWTVKQDLRLPSKEAELCCIIAICQVNGFETLRERERIGQQISHSPSTFYWFSFSALLILVVWQREYHDARHVTLLGFRDFGDWKEIRFNHFCMFHVSPAVRVPPVFARSGFTANPLSADVSFVLFYICHRPDFFFYTTQLQCIFFCVTDFSFDVLLFLGLLCLRKFCYLNRHQMSGTKFRLDDTSRHQIKPIYFHQSGDRTMLLPQSGNAFFHYRGILLLLLLLLCPRFGVPKTGPPGAVTAAVA